MTLPNHYKLRPILTLLNGLVSNNSYNLTENDIQILIKFIKIENDTTNFTETFITTDIDYIDCGYRLRGIAEEYATSYHPYIAIAVCLFGTIANILNVVVLTRKEMICAPINRILTALAVADMLVMVEYIPYVYYYYMVLPQSLDFSYVGAIYMLFHAHVTQTLHTTSICLTLTLAIWRYLALGYPEKLHILCSEFRCSVGIILSCILPIMLCIPAYITISITSQEIIENKSRYTLYHTDLSEMFKTDKTILKINFWIYAVFIKLLPCCILTIISCWLIRTLVKAKKRKQVLRSYHCYVLSENGKETSIKPMKVERRAERTTKMLVTVLVLFLLTEFPQGIFALLIGIKGKDLFLECYQLYGEIMDILALISGAINFILYCCMNRMFRTTFGQLFKPRILMWNAWNSRTPTVSEVHDVTLHESRMQETELNNS